MATMSSIEWTDRTWRAAKTAAKRLHFIERYEVPYTVRPESFIALALEGGIL